LGAKDAMKKLKTYIFGGEKIGKTELLKQLLSPELDFSHLSR